MRAQQGFQRLLDHAQDAHEDLVGAGHGVLDVLLAEAGGYPDSRAVREKTKGQIWSNMAK